MKSNNEKTQHFHCPVKIDSGYDPKSSEGNCFSASYFLFDANIEIPNITLVHAVIKPHKGALSKMDYEHAWVEMDDMVYDFSNTKRLIMKSEEYYTHFTLKKLAKWTMKEFYKKAHQHGTYGPWWQ